MNLESIRKRLRPMNLRIVSNETGVSYNKLWYILNGRTKSVKESDATRIAQWMEKQL